MKRYLTDSHIALMFHSTPVQISPEASEFHDSKYSQINCIFQVREIEVQFGVHFSQLRAEDHKEKVKSLLKSRKAELCRSCLVLPGTGWRGEGCGGPGLLLATPGEPNGPR